MSPYDYEVIFVDDGSTDRTASIIESFGNPRVSVLNFIRNRGHQNALDAGYRAAKGDFVVSMDGDLQHPIDVLISMIELSSRESIDVIYAVRAKRVEDALLKRLSAKFYYFFLRQLSGVEIRTSAADFRLISRRVVDILNQLPRGGTVFRLAIPSFGFPSREIEYEAADRFAGKSKYNLRKMFRLFSDSVLTSSTKPLGLGIQLGLIMAIISFIGFLYALVVFAEGQSLPGWTSLISVMLLMFGVVFMLLGIIGVYVGQLVVSVRQMPPYILDLKGISEKG